MAADPYKYFRVEARELLDQMSSATLELEKRGSGANIVQRLLRHAHTLKGAARIVRQPEIADAAHGIEDVLAPYRMGEALVAHEHINGLLKWLDTISARLAVLNPPQQQNVSDAHIRIVRHAAQEVDELLDGLAETHARLSTLRRSNAQLERACRLADLLAEQLEPRHATQIDRASALADELRSALASLERGVGGALDDMDRELWQARDTAEQLRLVPAEMLFTVLDRTVRDAAQLLSKSVTLRTSGGAIRVDADILSTVQPALVQLARNAVAHGIQVQGCVDVSVTRRGRHVVFTVADDGRGIDIDAVRRALVHRGVTETVDDKNLLRLLLTGGISTAQDVTEMAGRGVGLDVTRAAVERLRGEIAMRTQAGRGTLFELTLPLSLVALQSLLIESKGAIATLPLDAVRRAMRIAPSDVSRTADRASIVFEGKVIPFISLAQALKHKAVGNDANRTWATVVVEGRSGFAALAVDRMLGTATVVMRPLPELALADAVVAGASFDAEGNPQLMLDPDGLVAAAAGLSNTGAPVQIRLPVLVIDDSLTTRMLELSILESAGYATASASSAEEGLEKLRHGEFGLILVDVEMPGMDGFEFVARIRAEPALRDIPAILVTSRAAPEDKHRGERVGAQGYIVKSEFDQSELLARIKRLLG